MKLTLKTGDKAFVDSAFHGLMPCIVTRITGESGNPSSRAEVRVKLTANRGAFKRGEYLTEWSMRVIPRGAVYARGQRIRHYQVIAD